MANRLRLERQLRGWTQEDLAARSGISQTDISRYERGVRPQRWNAGRLAAAFEVPPETVYGWLSAPAESAAGEEAVS